MKKISKIVRITMLCALFCTLLLAINQKITDIVIPKAANRYYILEKYLEDHPEKNNYDVQIFGSCHAYTSFDPIYFEEQTGTGAFVYGNPSEIIPVTYARMAEQFRRHTPKVALVDIWGIDPYDTYLLRGDILGYYLPNDLECVDFSIEKQEVIRGLRFLKYDDISFLTMNFPIMNYKDRLVDGTLTDLDFNYSFEKISDYSPKTAEEMELRFANNGFKRSPANEVNDFPAQQANVGEECMDIEPEIERYILKIINLCKKRKAQSQILWD